MRRLRTSLLLFGLVLGLCGCAQRKTVRYVDHPMVRPDAAMAAPTREAARPAEEAALLEIDEEDSLAESAPRPMLEVHFIDVGQGDCTLIKCPDGSRILVDAGSSTKNFNADPVRDYLLSHLDPDEPRVDALVITHPDSDHYDLVPYLLEGVLVGHIYTAGYMNEHEQASVDGWLAAFEPARRTRLAANIHNVSPPRSLGEFGDVQVWVLASNVADISVESPVNTRSVVLKVTYGTVDILLTGDATRDTENDIMARLDPGFLDVEVLKLGHHGSNATSTSAEWAAVVRPEIAVASAGHNNTYGHPHRDVVGRIEPYTITADAHPFRWSWREGQVAKFADFDAYTEAVYSTAVNGTIVVTTDGTTIDLTHDE